MPPKLNPGYVVIGAGLPRTGTATLKAALEQLLEGSVYGVSSFHQSEGTADIDFWNKVLSSSATVDDWRRFVGERGLKGGVNFPFSLYWKEQLRLFPEAKVILTVRSRDSWYRSTKEHVYERQKDAFLQPFICIVMTEALFKLEMISSMVWSIPEDFDTSLCEAFSQGYDKAIQFYDKWTAEVKAEVPKERLLVFEVEDGWEPLCKFLDVPVPETPFPHLLKTERSPVGYCKMAFLIAVMSFALYNLW